jgi:5'-nucleotidase
MTYKFDAGKPVGERIEEVYVNEEPLSADKTYKLVTNDFMAAGGDGYEMFKGKTFVAEGGLLSDVLIDYFKEVKEVEPVVEGRVTVIPAVVEDSAPVEVPATEVKELPVEKPAPVPEPAPAPAVKKYVVKAGDVLWKIARSFETTWEKLAEFNNLKNPHLIFPGQELLIP